MKIPSINTGALCGFVLLLTIAQTSNAGADDLAKRKPGLWETQATMLGMSQSVQECVGTGTGDSLLDMTKSNSRDCSTMDIRKQSGGVTLHAVCTVGNTTATTDAVFTGDFSSSYQGKITTHFDKPVGGISDGVIVVSGKWLGPCASDQKPGSATATLPNNMGTIDLNDPKVKAMLEQLKESMKNQQQ